MRKQSGCACAAPKSLAAQIRLRKLPSGMTQRTQRNRIVALLCAVCTGAVLLIAALNPERFQLSEQFVRWELGAKDVLLGAMFPTNLSKLQPDPRLVFVGI